MAAGAGGLSIGALVMFVLAQTFGAGRDVAALQAEVHAITGRMDRVEAKLDRVLSRHKALIEATGEQP